MDVADGYVTFVRHSQDMLREKVNEEVYIERLFDVSKLEHPLLLQTMKQTLVFVRSRPLLCVCSFVLWCFSAVCVDLEEGLSLEVFALSVSPNNC
ncbi:hypothetical protein INR49_031918 [Caranx melampygus]|nr:hypothetical protein INR49_031918 [Caranx melampygus]